MLKITKFSNKERYFKIKLFRMAKSERMVKSISWTKGPDKWKQYENRDSDLDTRYGRIRVQKL